MSRKFAAFMLFATLMLGQQMAQGGEIMQWLRARQEGKVPSPQPVPRVISIEEATPIRYVTPDYQAMPSSQTGMGIHHGLLLRQRLGSLKESYSSYRPTSPYAVIEPTRYPWGYFGARGGTSFSKHGGYYNYHTDSTFTFPR